MKTIRKIVGILIVFLSVFSSCSKNEEEVKPELNLVGKKGNPRFNLVFDNHENVDLDLHVIDPEGHEIYFSKKNSPTGGKLDVDCLCGECPQGPNENIYWPLDGSAPKGKYQFWVNYYQVCSGLGSTNKTSNYTVRVLESEELKATYTGKLVSGQSETWTYVNL